MSRVFLVRHGETVWHAENRYAGLSDIALTKKGREQAERLGRWAVGAELSGIYSSTLSRARLTAAPAAMATGLRLQTNDRLLELDFGKGEGLTEQEMRARFPEALALYQEDPVRYPLPGSENPEHAADRGVRAIESIAAAAGPAGRSLVVAHNTLFRLVLCRLLGIPLSRYRIVFPKIVNGAITELQFSAKGASLLRFNLSLEDPALLS